MLRVYEIICLLIDAIETDTFQNISTEKKANQNLKTLDDQRVQCRECGQEMKTEDRQALFRVSTLREYLHF